MPSMREAWVEVCALSVFFFLGGGNVGAALQVRSVLAPPAGSAGDPLHDGAAR
jgi:hypothetical protein